MSDVSACTSVYLLPACLSDCLSVMQEAAMQAAIAASIMSAQSEGLGDLVDPEVCVTCAYVTFVTFHMWRCLWSTLP